MAYYNRHSNLQHQQLVAAANSALRNIIGGDCHWIGAHDGTLSFTLTVTLTFFTHLPNLCSQVLQEIWHKTLMRCISWPTKNGGPCNGTQTFHPQAHSLCTTSSFAAVWKRHSDPEEGRARAEVTRAVNPSIRIPVVAQCGPLMTAGRNS